MSPSCCAKVDQRRALTLLELVVVLGILALLSTVAVRSLEPIADQARYEVTQRLLNDLRHATVAGSTSETGDRPSVRSSFLTDTGELPIDAHDLLIRPVSLSAYAVQTFDSDRDSTQDVTLSSGWNGPYLQLGAGLSQIVDGWGAAAIWIANSGELKIVSLGSDGDSIAPENGYRADLSVDIKVKDYTGDLIFRLFAIDSLTGSRIDPTPTGTEQLGVLFYGINAGGGTNGQISEQLITVSNSGSFEQRRSNSLCGATAARAILWNDLNGDHVLDIGEAIIKKSIVHYPKVLPATDVRVEMELR